MHGILRKHNPAPVAEPQVPTLHVMRHMGCLYSLVWGQRHGRDQYEWCHGGDHRRPVTNLWLVNSLWSQYIAQQGQ